MPTDRSTIRVKAFAVILDDAGTKHAVSRMSTSENPIFHRPLGGSIELGEHSADAVVREIHEELGATFVRPELLGVLESVFTINGEMGHEVVFVRRLGHTTLRGSSLFPVGPTCVSVPSSGQTPQS